MFFHNLRTSQLKPCFSLAEKMTPALKFFQWKTENLSAFLTWHMPCNELFSLINKVFNHF